MPSVRQMQVACGKTDAVANHAETDSLYWRRIAGKYIRKTAALPLAGYQEIRGEFDMDSIRPKLGPEEALRRIAQKNQPPAKGSSQPVSHFVPACKLHSRVVALELVRELTAAGIESKTRHRRLWTHVAVRPSDLARTLQLQSELLTRQPDVPRRSPSRDYDVFFLVTPFILLATFLSLPFGYAFIGVLTTGFSTMLLWERFHRRYRYQAATEFKLNELLLFTALCAVNFAVWFAVWVAVL
ncbi:MAG: hypothetical protein Aurels2KO_33920 [Aureliella sp.]